MAEKISTLVLKVDLNCYKCYNKIRKILCRFHCKIKGQIYDEKNNTVTICGPFDPIKFSKKLKCKAGDVITNIEIKKEAEKDKKTQSQKKADKIDEKNSSKKDDEVVDPNSTRKKQTEQNIVVAVPVTGYPVPYGFCCRPCYEGHYGWGPWYHPGYGKPPPCYDAYGRSQCYCGCGGNRGNVSVCGGNSCGSCGGNRGNVSGCDFFVVEENPTTCTIM